MLCGIVPIPKHLQSRQIEQANCAPALLFIPETLNVLHIPCMGEEHQREVLI